MKLLYKFLLPVVIITIGISIITGYTISKQIKENALKRSQAVTADYINGKALEYLTKENFQSSDFLSQGRAFESFMHLIKTKEVIKIKVYNAQSDIIYSTAAKDIGKKTDSAYYQKALQGQTAVVIKPPIDEQANIELLGYKQLMEVYVPIVYDNKIEGVIEGYYNLDSVNADIQETTKKIIALIIIFALALLIVTYVILKIVVINPVIKLKEVSDRISNGDLSVKLPEIKSKDEIRDLNEALKGVFAAIEFLTDEIKRKNTE